MTIEEKKKNIITIMDQWRKHTLMHEGLLNELEQLIRAEVC